MSEADEKIKAAGGIVNPGGYKTGGTNELGGQNLRPQPPSPEHFATLGLRHRVSDMLREAGAPVEIRKGFLGHANQDISEITYGGRAARLREFHKWAVKAGL